MGKQRPLLLAFLVSCAVAATTISPAATAPARPGKGPQPKTHPELQELSREHATRGSANAQAHRRRGTFIDTDDVTISAVPATTPVELLRDLESLGLTEGVTGPNVVQGRLPVAAIDAAEDLGSLRYMRPEWGASGAGAVFGDGDAAMWGPATRTKFGVDGSGVKVGVISDSYNCLGGAANDAAGGDLPALAAITPVTEGSCTGATDEGRAMMQIVHDVAPGASLAFAAGLVPQIAFASRIRNLKTAGAKVIVDDLAIYADPWFQDGPIAKAIDEVTKEGVSYFSLAGNFARESYEYPYRASGQAGRGGTPHDFDPGPGDDHWLGITVPAHSAPLIALQWNDVFGTYSSTGAGPQTDLDLYALRQDTGALIAQSVGFNITTTKEPFELITINNLAGSTPFNARIEIDLYAGPAPRVLKIIDFTRASNIFEHNTFSGTVVGHPNATTAMAVGAVPFTETPPYSEPNPTLEPFSSAGGTAVWLKNDGTPFSKPSFRKAPRFSAPDGVNTTFFGTTTSGIDSDAYPNFFGTSAAGPHAAGVAALAIDKVPKAKWYDVCNALSKTATEMYVDGYDFNSGYGLIDALKTLKFVKARSYGPCRKRPR